MRVVYNDDLSPDTPEAKQDFFHCLTGCGNQNYFNFINLIPSRFVFIDVRLLMLSDVFLTLFIHSFHCVLHSLEFVLLSVCRCFYIGWKKGLHFHMY